MQNPVPAGSNDLPVQLMRLPRAFLISAALSLLFLVATAYTSAATLISRVESTEVMKAATQGVWSGQIAWQLVYFVTAQILLHLAFGALAWLLACSSATVWPELRKKLGRIVVGWLCLLAAATIAYNALWYPRTLMGAHYYDAMSRPIGPMPVGQWVYLTIVAAAGIVLSLAAWRVYQGLGPSHRKALLVAAASVGAFGIVSALIGRTGLAGAAPTASSKPNVIILGIDSLRLDQLRRFGGEDGNTPHLDRFLADVDIFRDTTTPAARTFSSWTAILTGRSPPVTRARFNLAPRDAVAANPTIGDVLRRSGYQTVYSTDEVRFANFDQSYGFDEVITPPIGASDFLIGSYNELPLASVFINTRIGQFLFPFSYGNRGVATMFQPRTYLGRLERELKFDRPTLFIAHLTASHWPYYTSETPFGISKKKSQHDRPLYRNGLKTADSMFGQVVSMLERKGALENAIVIVLSDHGEALALPNDSIFKNGSWVKGLGAPLKMLNAGHGQSVLSPTQYHVLLGFKALGPHRRFTAIGRNIDVPATVEDISPTILGLLDLPQETLAANGQSYARLLTFGSAGVGEDRLTERIRFTETDLAVLPAPNGEVDEIGTARANARFFKIDPLTGRLHLRHDFAPLALAYKERAAFTSSTLLAAIPAGPDAHQYLLFDLETGGGELIMSRPGAESTEGQRLWDAMEVHYAGELKPATRITRQDWLRLEREWADFFKNRSSPVIASKLTQQNTTNSR